MPSSRAVPERRNGYSNAKVGFQSFFMLMHNPAPFVKLVQARFSRLGVEHLRDVVDITALVRLRPSAW